VRLQGYVLEIAEAFKSADAAELQRILEEKQPAIEADANMGLAKQVGNPIRRKSGNPGTQRAYPLVI
jgi:hypothetical protein